MTYTYVILEVSQAVYDEIAGKLRAAAYDQAFHEDADGSVVIDMHGIALKREPGGLTVGSRSFERLSQSDDRSVDHNSPGGPSEKR